MIKTTTYKLTIKFLTPLLGAQPSREITEEYIAKKHGITLREDEEQMLPELLERGTSIFHRQADDSPAMMNYQILGFLKAAGQALNGKTCGVKNLRSKVATYVTVTPRVIPLHLPKNESIDYFERPLRTEGVHGSRVIIARSEMVPEGTKITCGLEVIDSEISTEVIQDLLSYGFSHGLGQFRGSGAFGTFSASLEVEN